MPAPVRIGLAGYGLGGRLLSRAADRLRRDLRVPRGGHHLGRAPPRGRRRSRSPGVRLPAGACQGGSRSGGDLHAQAATHVPLTPTRRCALAWRSRATSRTPRMPIQPARTVGSSPAAPEVPLTEWYQNRRWDSDFLTLRELLDKGSLGALTRFESRFDQRPGQRPDHRRAVHALHAEPRQVPARRHHPGQSPAAVRAPVVTRHDHLMTAGRPTAAAAPTPSARRPRNALAPARVQAALARGGFLRDVRHDAEPCQRSRAISHRPIIGTSSPRPGNRGNQPPRAPAA